LGTDKKHRKGGKEEMKVAVVGSRSFNDYEFLEKSILETLDVTDIDEIVSGGAYGADSLGVLFAKNHSKPYTIHHPNWDLYGRKAGFIRNREIVRDSDIVIAFWDGQSKGTKNTIELAEKQSKKTYIFFYSR
jgi:hypothetical protein